MEQDRQASIAQKRRRQQRMRMKKRRQKIRRIKLAMAGVGILIVSGFLLFFILRRSPKEVDPAAGVMVNEIDLTGMSWEEAMETLHSSYQWQVQVTYQGQSYAVEDYLKEDITDILNEIYAGNGQKTYQLEITEPEEKAAALVEILGDMWNQPATDSQITAYNKETGSFEISDGASGTVIDTENLIWQLEQCFEGDNYEVTLEAKSVQDEPVVHREDYRKIGTYTTKTTNNKDRNTNVTLSCAAVCGTILQPGEQFSYNGTVGERTAEKGYQLAGAYSNGAHVQELGGGVCQLSSTMYNAAVSAGLQVDERTGHSYEPSYVTPGEDATVSYQNPDFKFTNNSTGTLGIKTSFYDHTVTVEIYGVPVLEEGVTQYMESAKTEDTPEPETQYILDENLEAGTQIQDTAGKMGSKWVTNLVVERDGVVESEAYLHTTKYLGTAAVIRCNPLPEGVAATSVIPLAGAESVDGTATGGETTGVGDTSAPGGVTTEGAAGEAAGMDGVTASDETGSN